MFFGEGTRRAWTSGACQKSRIHNRMLKLGDGQTGCRSHGPKRGDRGIDRGIGTFRFVCEFCFK